MDASDTSRLFSLLESRAGDLTAGRPGCSTIYHTPYLLSLIERKVGVLGRISVILLSSELEIEPKKLRELIDHHLKQFVLVQGSGGEETMSNNYLNNTIYEEIETAIENRGPGGITPAALALYLSIPLELLQELLSKRKLHRSTLTKSGLFCSISMLSRISEELLEYCKRAEESVEITSLASQFNIDTNEVMEILSKAIQNKSLQGEIYAGKILLPFALLERREVAVISQLRSSNVVTISYLRTLFISSHLELMQEIAIKEEIKLVQFSKMYVKAEAILSVSTHLARCNSRYYDSLFPESLETSNVDAGIIHTKTMLQSYNISVSSSDLNELISFCSTENISNYIEKCSDSIVLSSGLKSIEISNGNKTSSKSSIAKSTQQSAPKLLRNLKLCLDGNVVLNRSLLDFLAHVVIFPEICTDVSNAAIDISNKLKNKKADKGELWQSYSKDIVSASKLNKYLMNSKAIDLSMSKVFGSNIDSSNLSIDENTTMKTFVPTEISEALVGPVLESLQTQCNRLSMHSMEYRDALFESMWKQLYLRLRSLAVLEGRKADEAETLIMSVSEAWKSGTQDQVLDTLKLTSCTELQSLHQNILEFDGKKIISMLVQFILYENNVLHLFQDQGLNSSRQSSRKSILNINSVMRFPLSKADLKFMSSNMPKTMFQNIFLILTCIPNSLDIDIEKKEENEDEAEFGTVASLETNSKNAWYLAGLLHFSAPQFQVICRFEKKRELKNYVSESATKQRLSCLCSTLTSNYFTNGTETETSSLYSEKTLVNFSEGRKQQFSTFCVELVALIFMLLNDTCLLDKVYISSSSKTLSKLTSSLSVSKRSQEVGSLVDILSHFVSLLENDKTTSLNEYESISSYIRSLADTLINLE